MMGRKDIWRIKQIAPKQLHHVSNMVEAVLYHRHLLLQMNQAHWCGLM